MISVASANKHRTSKLRADLVRRAAKSFRAGPRYFTPWAVDRGSHASAGQLLIVGHAGGAVCWPGAG